MASYRIIITTEAREELHAMPFPFRRQINGRIHKLKNNPRPSDAVSVGEVEERLRLKYGGWKILFEVDDTRRVVTIVGVSAFDSP